MPPSPRTPPPAPSPPSRRASRPPPPPSAPRYRSAEILERPEPPSTAPVAQLAPFLDWREFMQEVSFAQGDHITLVGRTKSGKTTLAVGGLLPLFSDVVVAGTKARDDSLYGPLIRKGYKLTSDPRLDYRRTPKVIFRPELRTLSEQALQREGFRAMLNAVFVEGGWALYLDEVRYLSDTLRLRAELETLWLQGRSLGVTMIASTQEPVSIPRVAFSQIEHLFLWRLTDRERVIRAGELAGALTDEVRAIVPVLSQHEALYVAPSNDLLLRTRYPRALAA